MSTVVEQIEQQIAEQRKLHFQNVDAAREANESLVRDTKSTADAIIRVQEDRVRRYQQMEEDAIAAVTESQRRSISMKGWARRRRLMPPEWGGPVC